MSRVDPTLPPNCTCEYCGIEFRMLPIYMARKKREGKHFFCSRSCAQKYHLVGKLNHTKQVITREKDRIEHKFYRRIYA